MLLDIEQRDKEVMISFYKDTQLINIKTGLFVTRKIETRVKNLKTGTAEQLSCSRPVSLISFH
jgi:hypothetical protein